MNVSKTLGEISGYCEFIHKEYKKYRTKYPDGADFNVSNPINRYRTKNAFQRLLLHIKAFEDESPIYHDLLGPIGHVNGKQLYVGDILHIAIKSTQFSSWAEEIGCSMEKLMGFHNDLYIER